jgi:hypothetical protein
MRFLEAPLAWSTMSQFGATGGFTAAVGNFGIPLPGTSGWQSDPVDCRGQVSLSLEISALLAPSPAMLLIPSTTAGLGLLFVSKAANSAADAIQITISTPAAAPAIRSITTTGNSIVIAPAVGDINATIASLVNGGPAPTNMAMPQVATASTLNVISTAGFPASGTLVIVDNTGATESIVYVGISATSFNGCSGGTSGNTFAAGATVALYNAAAQLVQAYPFGWQGYGDMTVVPQSDPTEGAQVDLVAAKSITNLIGGCDNAGELLVPCSQSGVVTLYGSSDPKALGFDLNTPLASGNLATGKTITLNAINTPRFVMAQFVPNPGSFGSVQGRFFGRAAA